MRWNATSFCIALGAVAALAAQAEPKTTASQGLEAELQMLGSEQMRVEWRGQRAVRVSKRMCVASSTGRFQLVMRRRGSFGPDHHDLTYEVRFRGPDGHERTLEIGGAGEIVFRGTVEPEFRCSSGANAKLDITLTQAAALQGLAGEYSSNFEFELIAL
ncbi:MAG: hypothetical protein RIB03_12845 [Henriciella sp.]|uniref:hypothetical protein n=1 Tax=Henriciella sp. TaxID=1968823 RepID=UPI0032EC8DBF